MLRIDRARERQNVLAAALDSGLTHFDTAPIYGFGEAERSLGVFLARQRGRVTLATKFGLRPSRLATRLVPLQRVARQTLRAFPLLRGAAVRGSGALYSQPDFSIDSVRTGLDASLRALRTDHVDFFLAHQASESALPPEELIDLLERLRAGGKIGDFGVATEFNWLGPVLQQRPRLNRVVQFDSELTTANVSALGAPLGRLLITYGFITRTIATCRERLRDADLAGLEDETLGGLVLRAAVLANPTGLTLMQSRSPARIARNVGAATTAAHDEMVERLAQILGTRC